MMARTMYNAIIVLDVGTIVDVGTVVEEVVTSVVSMSVVKSIKATHTSMNACLVSKPNSS
jgi:hypothetical protein